MFSKKIKMILFGALSSIFLQSVYAQEPTPTPPPQTDPDTIRAMYDYDNSQANKACTFGTSYSDRALCFIARFTNYTRNATVDMLIKLDQLPILIPALTRMALSWNNTDDKLSDDDKGNNIIATDQELFAQLGKNYTTASPEQVAMTAKFTTQFLLAGVKSKPNTPPPTLASPLPFNPNDLSYTTLLGSPLVQPQTKNEDEKKNALELSIRNYIQNASASSFHVQHVDPAWGTDSVSAKQYVIFYNALASIESFNSYVITDLYKQKTGTELTTKLIDNATNSNWFLHVENEPLGVVLRQLLMYDSQIFVQLHRLVQLQEQQLTSIAMGNSLLVMLVTKTVGELLIADAKKEAGISPLAK